VCCVALALVPYDEFCDPLPLDDPPGARTPPTPLVMYEFHAFLYEFPAFRFEILYLPPLPADRSDFDVHGALNDKQVQYM
jgi:hypothetical protein